VLSLHRCQYVCVDGLNRGVHLCLAGDGTEAASPRAHELQVPTCSAPNTCLRADVLVHVATSQYSCVCRAVKSKRDYLQQGSHFSWLYLSRLAAVKEFAFMKALADHALSVPQASAKPDGSAIRRQTPCACRTCIT
jgi:hypothetical protein